MQELLNSNWCTSFYFQGQFFSGNDKRIYLLGNPIIWWGNLGFLALFLCLYGAISVREQRGGAKMSPKMQTTLETCLWLFLGWALHYIPFWGMGRVLYFHHYFPAQLYASMITAVVLDYLIQVSFERIFGPNVNSVWQHSVIAVITSFICWR